MNEFKKFWLSMPIENRKSTASKVGKSYSHLNKYAFSRTKKISFALAIDIQRETGFPACKHRISDQIDFDFLKKWAKAA